MTDSRTDGLGPMSRDRISLAVSTSQELATEASMRPLLLVPVGSCEQHGPHLPLDTDTRLAIALATAAAERLDRASTATGRADRPGARALVAPALTITASGEHAGFPGTLSIGTEVMTAVLIELVRSADWADGVVLVNGHGGNAVAVRDAVDRSIADGRHVVSWWPRIVGADAHAGHTETSMMLAVDPAAVRLDLAEPGRREPVAELIDELRVSGVRGVSPNGVLGDPTGATAVHGREIIARLVDDLTASVEAWRASRP